jgi:integrase
LALTLRHLTIHEQHKETTTTAKALLAFYRFMEKESMRFRDLTSDPRDGPIWKFRNFLCENIYVTDEHGRSHGHFAISTVRSYISQVVRYYAWLINEEYLEVSDHYRPFNYRWVTSRRDRAKNDDAMLSHTWRNQKLQVKTTDIIQSLPRVQSIPEWQRLRPMTPKHKVLFENTLSRLSIEKRLMFRLALESGLRLSEMVTFSSHHIIEPLNNQVIHCEIGPAVDGCKTKYSKIRIIKIPANLMAELYQYKLSDQRLERLDKAGVDIDLESQKHPKNRIRLFLSNRGQEFKADTIDKSFSTEIRSFIDDPQFRYRVHDIRATFATYWLHKKTIGENKPARLVAHELMALMGHQNFSTTEKYIAYLDNTAIWKKHAHRLNEG